MRRFIYTAIAFAAMTMATSCEKDAINSTSGEGGFSLTLNVNDSVQTRALTDDQKNTLINSSLVKIYRPDYKGLIRNYTYSDMPEVVYLPSDPNNYRVDVIAGEAATTNPRKANFDQKSYKGSAEFKITANQITDNVAVTAQISNAITNVSLDQTIFDIFGDSYSLVFSLEENTTNNTLVYDKNVVTTANTAKEGYFIIDENTPERILYWAFSGTKVSDGTTFTANGEIEAPEGGLIGTRHTMLFKYVVKDGTLTFDLELSTGTESVTDDIIWTPTSTGISTIGSTDIWAKFATVKADVDSGTYNTDKVYFQYRPKPTSETAWADPTIGNDDMAKASLDSNGTYSTVITALDPNTEYEYRLVVYTLDTTDEENNTIAGTIDTEILNNAKTFTTKNAQQVPNASFEQYYKKDDRYHVFNPEGGYGYTQTYTGDDGTHTWWGTGNQYQTVVTVDITTADLDVPHSQNNKVSVKMTTDAKAGKLAAGNIYSGYFKELINLSDGKVHFGRKKASDGSQFNSRPTGVSFYVKYEGKQVTDYSYTDVINKGEYDKGQIKFAIGNWSKKNGGGSDESPIEIYTADRTKNPLPAKWNLKSFNGTIAYCDKIFGGGADKNITTWKKVTLKFNYNENDNGTEPTHIIISAASSMYGDYFAGAKGSTMYLDDIELLYDYGVEDKIEDVPAN